MHVLRILPGPLSVIESQKHDPLEIEIEHVSLDSNPKYHALSYTLEGDFPPISQIPAHCESGIDITMNGEKVQITQNLSAALTTLCNWALIIYDQNPFPANTRVWVDAL
jgi:hypothetical protein